MKTPPTTMVPPSTAFMSALKQRVGDVAAEPRPGEHCLGQHRAFQQAGVGEGDDGDQRHHDVAEGMAPDRRATRTAP